MGFAKDHRDLAIRPSFTAHLKDFLNRGRHDPALVEDGGVVALLLAGGADAGEQLGRWRQHLLLGVLVFARENLGVEVPVDAEGAGGFGLAHLPKPVGIVGPPAQVVLEFH